MNEAQLLKPQRDSQGLIGGPPALQNLLWPTIWVLTVCGNHPEGEEKHRYRQDYGGSGGKNERPFRHLPSKEHAAKKYCAHESQNSFEGSSDT